MCVLTFIPFKEGGFDLTSNRDESPQRKKALFPSIKKTPYYQLIFPKDGDQGGTWIAATGNPKLVCLLNGAFEPHQPEPPYYKSRGLVVLDVFEYPQFIDFYNDSDLSGIEPFTMVCIEPLENDFGLYELKWDGENKHLTELDSKKPHLWASASLYSSQAQLKRNKFFHSWLQQEETIDWEKLEGLHTQLKMGRFKEDYLENNQLPPVVTRSITHISYGRENIIRYKDLHQQKIMTEALPNPWEKVEKSGLQ